MSYAIRSAACFSEMPHVSVIIPVFNRPELLHFAVQSVLAQSFTDYELIVVDDGSSVPLETVRELVESRRGQYLRLESNQGVSAARNAGVALSSGKYLAFLDSDDSWYPEKLARQVKFFETHPHYRLAQCREEWIRNGVLVNQKERHAMPDGEAFERSLELCVISPSAVILERELICQVGGFDERFRACEDYDLWLRITCQHQIGLLDEVLVRKTGGHSDQLSRLEPLLDRYRVLALLKLLAQAVLTPEQRGAVIAKLREKAAIIESGAKKRGLEARAGVYQELGSRLLAGESSADGFFALFEKILYDSDPR